MDIEATLSRNFQAKRCGVRPRHIFKPLDMKDAGFYVPADKMNRFTALFTTGPNGELVQNNKQWKRGARLYGRTHHALRWRRHGFNAMDYYRFAQMMADGGELNGKRILPGVGETDDLKQCQPNCLPEVRNWANGHEARLRLRL